MALFLTEAESDESPDIGCSGISIEEAYDGLLEASLDMHELTEAMLQADFSIHESGQYLSEEEQNGKEQNFIVRSAKAIHAFILKIRDRVVAFLKTMGAKLQALWAKITNKETNPSGKVKVVKGGIQAAEKLTQLSNNVDTAVNSQEKDPTKYKKAVGLASMAFNKAYEAIKKTVTTERNGVEVVDATKVRNVIAVSTALVTGAAAAHKKLTSDAKAVEVVEKKALINITLFNRANKAERERMKSEERAKTAPLLELARSYANAKVSSTGIRAKANKFAMNIVFGIVQKKVQL